MRPPTQPHPPTPLPPLSNDGLDPALLAAYERMSLFMKDISLISGHLSQMMNNIANMNTASSQSTANATATAAGISTTPQPSPSTLVNSSAIPAPNFNPSSKLSRRKRSRVRRRRRVKSASGEHGNIPARPKSPQATSPPIASPEHSLVSEALSCAILMGPDIAVENDSEDEEYKPSESSLDNESEEDQSDDDDEEEEDTQSTESLLDNQDTIRIQVLGGLHDIHNSISKAVAPLKNPPIEFQLLIIPWFLNTSPSVLSSQLLLPPEKPLDISEYIDSHLKKNPSHWSIILGPDLIEPEEEADQPDDPEHDEYEYEPSESLSYESDDSVPDSDSISSFEIDEEDENDYVHYQKFLSDIIHTADSMDKIPSPGLHLYILAGRHPPNSPPSSSSSSDEQPVSTRRVHFLDCAPVRRPSSP